MYLTPDSVVWQQQHSLPASPPPTRSTGKGCFLTRRLMHPKYQNIPENQAQPLANRGLSARGFLWSCTPVRRSSVTSRRSALCHGSEQTAGLCKKQRMPEGKCFGKSLNICPNSLSTLHDVCSEDMSLCTSLAPTLRH